MMLENVFISDYFNSKSEPLPEPFPLSDTSLSQNNRFLVFFDMAEEIECFK